MTTYRIYALSGPDLAVRYVGRTKTSLAARAAAHLGTAMAGKMPLHQWVREQGSALVMRELERLDNAEECGGYCPAASACEAKWIARFIEEGCDLFNRYLRPKPDPIRIITLDEQRKDAA